MENSPRLLNLKPFRETIIQLFASTIEILHVDFDWLCS